MAHSQENQFNFLKTLPHHCLKDEYSITPHTHMNKDVSKFRLFVFFWICI